MALIPELKEVNEMLLEQMRNIRAGRKLPENVRDMWRMAGISVRDCAVQWSIYKSFGNQMAPLVFGAESKIKTLPNKKKNGNGKHNGKA